MAQVPAFDNIVNQIYVKLNSLFGGDDPNQLFTMLFPTQPLNYRDYVYDTDSRTSVVTKPESVAEAEFRLADQLLDPAPIAVAPNGKTLSVVYRQLLDSYVPALAPLGPYLSDRAYLNAFLNQPITVGETVTTRMTLFDDYMQKYVEQKKAWVEERTERLRLAQDVPSTATAEQQQAAFDHFVDWVSTEAPVSEAALDAKYSAAVVQGYLHETLTILGYLNSASPAESLERAKQRMRHSERSSVDESMSVFPVQFQPSNWFTAMHPNLNPEDLTLAADAVTGALSSRRTLLAAARSDLERLQMITVAPGTLDKLKKDAEAARTAMDTAMDALVKQWGASTMHLASQILDMVKPPSTELPDWVTGGIKEETAKGVAAEEAPGKWVESLTGDLETAAPELAAVMAIDPEKIKEVIGTAVKDIADTYTKHVAQLRASQDYAVALRQQAAAEAGDFKLQIQHAQDRVKDLETDVRDLEAKVAGIHATKLAKAAGPDLSGFQSVLEHDEASRSEIVDAIASALDSMTRSPISAPGGGPTATYDWPAVGKAYNAIGKAETDAAIAAATAAGNTPPPAYAAVPDATWAGTGATPAQKADSVVQALGDSGNRAVTNDLLRKAGLRVISTYTSSEDGEEPTLLPASRLSSEADSMFTEVVVESTYSASTENTSSASQAHASSWNVSGWFFSAGGQSQESSARAHADAAMQKSSVTIGMRAMKVSFDRGGWFQPSLLEMSEAFENLTSNRAGLGISKDTLGAVAGKESAAGPTKAYIDQLRDAHTFNVAPPADASFLLPSYPMAMVIAKDITIRIKNDASASSSDSASASKSAASSGGFLFFSASNSSSSKSNSSTAFTGSRGQYTVIRIPGPQILGYVQQLVPEDKSRPYTPIIDASRGATVEDALKRFNEALAGTLDVGGVTGHQPVGAGGDGAATPSAPSPAPPVTANGNV